MQKLQELKSPMKRIPDVKENAERVLAQLGIPMATSIDMYLKQISLVGGIPFSVVLPKAANSVNADMA